MTSQADIDRELVHWGSRLFYGMPEKPRPGARDPRITAGQIRAQVRAAISPGAKQVVVKVSGGGRGMRAIAAHLRYISRQGKPEVGGKGCTLEMEDERGQKVSGAEAVRDLQADWQFAGGYLPETSKRREAFNVILSMPAGTPAEAVLGAARDFASETFAGHKYVLVLHDDTDSPHVHLAVRAERFDGVRMNPRKGDLRAWRERFARRLQDRGVNAVATPAASRGQQRAPQNIWRLKTQSVLHRPTPANRSAESVSRARFAVEEALARISRALNGSELVADQALSENVKRHAARRFGMHNPGEAGPSRDARSP